MEETLYLLFKKINYYLSENILVIMLIGIGLYYSIRTGFVQVRCFGEGMRRVFGNINLNGQKNGKKMSSFQALATAVAAQVGTGNIIGGSAAILTGGPGAIFWMWIIAFFGMATIYGEATLAISTREVDPDGTIHGGPVYYIQKAFKGKFGKFLAGFFSVAIILALGFMGCMVQSNSIAETMNTAFGIPTWLMGLILVVFCAVIFLGGVQRIASATEKIVPFMACVFILGCLAVLIVRIKYIPQTFAMIFRYAFKPQAIIGGSVGTAMKIAISEGAKKGLFSNEAGMGSTPHAHALADVKNPHEQGVVAMIGVFIDTFVVLTLNALVIISTLYTDGGIISETDGIPASINGSNLAQTAFSKIIGEWAGSKFVAVCLLFFAFSTILGWNMFGKLNAEYLFGQKNRKISVVIYTVISIGFVFLGTCVKNNLVWQLTDFFNNILVLPNVLALFVLGSVVGKIFKDRNKII